jgi:hypothetical protein
MTAFRIAVDYRPHPAAEWREYAPATPMGILDVLDLRDAYAELNDDAGYTAYRLTDEDAPAIEFDADPDDLTPTR